MLIGTYGTGLQKYARRALAIIITGIVIDAPCVCFFGISLGVNILNQAFIAFSCLMLIFSIPIVLLSKRVNKLRLCLGALYSSIYISIIMVFGIATITSWIPLFLGLTMQPLPGTIIASEGLGLGALYFVFFLSRLFFPSLGLPPGGSSYVNSRLFFSSLGMPSGDSSQLLPMLKKNTRFPILLEASTLYFCTFFWPRSSILSFVLIFISMIILAFYNAISTRKLAKSAFNSATIAHTMPIRKRHDLAWGIQLTDIHLTQTGKTRVDGEKGGNEPLREFVNKLLNNPPKFTFVTGDLTDRGDEAEWQEARQILTPLKEKGTRIIIAPGNHDLATAYDTEDAIRSLSLTHFRGGLINGMNGFRLLYFLYALAAFQPDLRDAKGETIESILKRENNDWVRFWKLIDEANQAISSNPSAKGYVVNRFCKKMEKLLPKYQPTAGWKCLLMSSKKDIIEYSVSSVYILRWYDYFPLYLLDNDTGTQIIILNSVSRDPTLRGSPWGDFGDDQISRLSHIIRLNPARQFVILAHHAPFRWSDERPPSLSLKEILRWACLATSLSSTNRLVEILTNIQRDGKKLLFFCGHRHGGGPREARIGSWCGIQVAEGVSLSNEDASILAAWQESYGLDCAFVDWT